MLRLVALKKLRYPISRDGKEYQVGESFEALSERDFKVLTAAKLAEVGAAEPPKTQRAPRRPRQPDEQPAEAKQLDASAGSPEQSQESDASRYLRRDMRAED